MNKSRYILLLLLLIPPAPSRAPANAGTPLMWASFFHLVLGNALIGVLEGLVLSWVFQCSKWKSIGRFVERFGTRTRWYVAGRRGAKNSEENLGRPGGVRPSDLLLRETQLWPAGVRANRRGHVCAGSVILLVLSRLIMTYCGRVLTTPGSIRRIARGGFEVYPTLWRIAL